MNRFSFLKLLIPSLLLGLGSLGAAPLEWFPAGDLGNPSLAAALPLITAGAGASLLYLAVSSRYRG